MEQHLAPHPLKADADNLRRTFPALFAVDHSAVQLLHAVNQMQKNIKLVSYRKYDDDLILFEHLNAPVMKAVVEHVDGIESGKNSNTKSHVEKLAMVSDDVKKLYASVCDFIESLGDDISQNQLKLYLAYKKVQNMVCVEIQSKQVILYLKLNPESVILEKGFTS